MTNEQIAEHLREQSEQIKEMMAQLQTMWAAYEKAKAEEAKPPFVRQPMEKYDWASNMSMPRNAIEAMVAAVGDKMMRDIVSDHVGKPAQHRLVGAAPKVEGSSGWVSPKPLGPQPGIEQIDAQLDAADAEDRRALAQRLAKPE